MVLKLWTYPGNKNAFKALIAAEAAGVKVELPPFQMGVDNKSAEFLAKNPIGKVGQSSTLWRIKFGLILGKERWIWLGF